MNDARRLHRAAPRRRRPWRRYVASLGVLVLLALIVGAVQLLRPLPEVVARRVELPRPQLGPGRTVLPAVPGAEITVALDGVGTLASSTRQAEVPIASVAKVMSALVVLADHPLRGGETGPSIRITAADVATYERESAAQDSVVAVRAGEQMSERTALEAALVPSADNVVQLLATWDAGSRSAFVARMNAEARRLGLVHTHYAGPSGVDPATVSTAADQVRLATIALENPVLASIVSKPQVTLPVAGVQYNVDADLGHDGIVGVKTGWVPQGGASFVFAARRRVGALRTTVVGAIVGDQAVPALPTVLAAARRVVRAADDALVVERAVASGERVGSLYSGYGSPVPVVTAGTATLLGWRGAHPVESMAIAARLHVPIAAGTRVGTLTVSLGSERRTVTLVTAGHLGSPSLSWRLTRG